MKLTRSVSYAVGILLQVQNTKSSQPMTAAQISKGCKFPPRFLYRVLRKLVDAGLMSGVSGPGGGYVLAQPPQKITLLDIVAAVEGTPEPSVLEPVNGKHKRAIATINALSRTSAARCRKELSKVTLAKLQKR